MAGPQMSVYVRGNRIITRAEFRVPDEAGALTSPTTVVFTARAKGAAATVYTWGSSSEVTNPSTGVFELALKPTADVVMGVHVQGDGTVIAAGEIFWETRSKVLA